MNEVSHRTALFDWRENELGFAQTKMADMAPRSYMDEEFPPAGRGRKKSVGQSGMLWWEIASGDKCKSPCEEP